MFHFLGSHPTLAFLVVPEVIEAVCRKLRIVGGVLDILVPQVVLDGARILSIVTVKAPEKRHEPRRPE